MSIRTTKNEPGVYFIGSDDGGPVKIGKSLNKEERLRELQTGNSRRLEILVFLKFEGMALLENRLHRYFADFRLEGEWFKLDVRVATFIEAARRVRRTIVAGGIMMQPNIVAYPCSFPSTLPNAQLLASAYIHYPRDWGDCLCICCTQLRHIGQFIQADGSHLWSGLDSLCNVCEPRKRWTPEWIPRRSYPKLKTPDLDIFRPDTGQEIQRYHRTDKRWVEEGYEPMRSHSSEGRGHIGFQPLRDRTRNVETGIKYTHDDKTMWLFEIGRRDKE